MKMIYIPSQLYVALQAANVKGSDLVCLKKLSGTLSPEDVAFYCYVNMCPDGIVPTEITGSFKNALIGAKNSEAVPQAFADPDLKEMNRLVNSYCLNKGAPQQLDIDGQVLSASLLDENIILFTHVQPNAEQQLQTLAERDRDLADQLTQLVYGFYTFEELAALPLMGSFLRATHAVMQKTA